MRNWDVRDFPNPPRELRKSHTGLSKRLRSELFQMEGAEVYYQKIVRIFHLRAFLTWWSPQLDEITIQISKWTIDKTHEEQYALGIGCHEVHASTLCFMLPHKSDVSLTTLTYFILGKASVCLHCGTRESWFTKNDFWCPNHSFSQRYWPIS